MARLVLVGDRRQLRGVEAGQPFRQLQQAGMATAEMDELRRQRNPDLRAAVGEMIGDDPGAALERLGGNLREIPAEEIAGAAAGLWLRLSADARAATALLAPTRALRAGVEEAVREGLETEGALGGHAMQIGTLVPLNLTRAETGDARNWREGDIALFNRDMKHYRIARDDACTVMAVEEDRVRLLHGDGRPRHLEPGSELRYRLDLFEAKTLTVREGERLRWTRNDRERGLVNGDRLEVLETGAGSLRARLADGREMTFARDDPQLRHLAYAYASTVHAAQGQTHERVIAVLDSGAGPLVNRQTLYVQLSRAQEEAVVLTDNRDQLVETLEANTGERLTALEAIGEEAVETAAKAPVKSAIHAETAAAFLDGLGNERRRRGEGLRRLQDAQAALEEARARAEEAAGAFAALPAGGLKDRQALRERVAAVERVAEAESGVVAAAEAFAAVAGAVMEALPGGAVSPEDPALARTEEARKRSAVWRSLGTALSTCLTASERLAPAGALSDREIDTASIERHGKHAREAASAFSALAGRAAVAGRAALSRDARARQRALDLDAQCWIYRLTGRRIVAALQAEKRMEPPLTVADVQAWRGLRQRRASAHGGASAIAETVADALEAGSPEVAVKWRNAEAQHRERAITTGDTLPALDELEARIRIAAAAPGDAAAWRAAADAAEGLMQGAGQALGEEAKAAAEQAEARRAEAEAARDCRRIRDAFAAALAAANGGAVIYRPGIEPLGAEAARLLATPRLSDGDRRTLENVQARIDGEIRDRDTIRSMIDRARAHLDAYPAILERALAPKPPPPAPEEPSSPPGLMGRARRLFRAEDDIPARPAPEPAPRALYAVDPDYRKWSPRASKSLY